MTDLPRFHTGAVGELTFAHINEMSRRLDALLPLVEQASVFDKDSLAVKPRVMVVFATPLTGKFEGKYQWREVILNAEDEPVGPEDDEWPELEAEGVSFRQGGMVDKETDELDDNYAVLLDINTEIPATGGYAICIRINRSDRKARYVLFAAVAGEPTGERPVAAVRIGEAIGPKAFGNINVYEYRGRRQLLSDTITVGDSCTVYDLGYHRPNPSNFSGSAQQTYHVLEVGSIVTGEQFSDTFWIGCLPRLDINCT